MFTKRLFCGVKYLCTNTQTHSTQMPHSMKPSPPQSSQPCFSMSYFFSPSQANCRRVAYIGMLPGLSCFKWNSLASTPPPPPATMSQTLTSLMERKKKTQCAMVVGSDKVQKMRQLQSQTRSADSGFGLLVLMLQVLLQDGPWLLEKELLSGSDWRELVVSNYRKWQDGKANKVFDTCLI